MTNSSSKIQVAVGQSNRGFDYNVDVGLLVARVGLGGMLMFYGTPKLMGGPEMWAGVGGAMKGFGMPLPAEFWGICAGLAEAVSGLFLALGLLFRPAAATIVFTMIVAAITMYTTKTFFDATHAIDVGIAVLGLMITGPGWFSLDRKIFNQVL